MLGFIPVFILLGAAITVVVLQFVPRGTGLAWFASVLFAIAAWIMVIILRTRLPLVFSGQFWTSLGIEKFFLAFRLDIITWPFALAICSLVAGVLLVSSVRIGLDSTSREWAGILLVGSLGFLGVTATNILTTLLILGCLDLFELALLVYKQNDRQQIESELKFILWRIAGLTLFLAAYGWQISLAGLTDDWQTLQFGPVLLTLAACVIRLGFIPLKSLTGSPAFSQNGLLCVRSLVGFLTVFVIMIQLPYYPIDGLWKTIILLYLLITALSATIHNARNQADADFAIRLPVAIGSLICASYVLGFSAAGFALSISFVTLTAILLLEYPINIFSRIFGVLAVIGCSGLPFTPNLLGFSAFGLRKDFPAILFIIPIIGILYSSSRILFRKVALVNPSAERWTEVLSPVGLIFPIITSWIVNFNNIPGQNFLQVSIPAFLSFFISVALLFNLRFKVFDFQGMLTRLSKLMFSVKLSPDGIMVHGRSTLIDLIQIPTNFIRNLYEGDGGVLWSVLSLVLIITIIRTLGLTP